MRSIPVFPSESFASEGGQLPRAFETFGSERKAFEWKPEKSDISVALWER